MYLKDENLIWVCKSGDQRICMIPKMANRHGLIAGATGTGKTVTLKVLSEAFSDMGVPACRIRENIRSFYVLQMMIRLLNMKQNQSKKAIKKMDLIIRSLWILKVLNLLLWKH